MKDLKLFIIESSNNHIDDFIKFIKEHSKQGELKHNSKSYYDYFDECDPFENNKFSLNINNTSYAEDYCEEHEIDFVEDDKENFIEYIKDIVDEQLTIDCEHGLIKCERVLKISNSNFSDYKNHLGIYWSFAEGMGDSHGAIGSSGNNITLIGLVDPKDVNWGETIAANIIDPDECEITINEDADIQIKKIIKTDNKDVLLEENLIYQA